LSLQDRFSCETEWRSLLLMLHRKVQALGDNTVLKPLYLQVTNGKLPFPLPYLSFCQCHKSRTTEHVTKFIFENFTDICWCFDAWHHQGSSIRTL